jgi:hypothetical protein
MFAHADFAAGANQAFPIVGTGRKLTGEKNLDATLQEIASTGIALADGLGVRAFAPSIKTRGKNASVVEHKQVAGLEQIGQIAKLAIKVTACGAKQVQHSRAVPGGERLLGNEFVGKMEMKIGNQHDVIIGGRSDSSEVKGGERLKLHPGDGLEDSFVFFGKFVCLFKLGALPCGCC